MKRVKNAQKPASQGQHISGFPEYMTSKQAAAILQVDERTIQRYAKERVLQGVKFGRDWRFRKDKFEEFIRLREVRSYHSEEHSRLFTEIRKNLLKEWIGVLREGNEDSFGLVIKRLSNLCPFHDCEFNDGYPNCLPFCVQLASHFIFSLGFYELVGDPEYFFKRLKALTDRKPSVDFPYMRVLDVDFD